MPSILPTEALGVEGKMLKHVKTMFGYHGGMGDPPPDNAIVAIICGAKEFKESRDTKEGHRD